MSATPTPGSSYPHRGALAAARLRGAASHADLEEVAAVASVTPVADLVDALGVHAARRSWGGVISCGLYTGVVVLDGGVAVPYSGQQWKELLADEYLADELVALPHGWVVDTPQAQRLGFAPTGAGAISAAAALGLRTAVAIDYPVPMGPSGRAVAPGGDEVAADEAWAALRRVPALWVAAAELWGVEVVLGVVVNRTDGGATVGADEVLAALWPGENVAMVDDSPSRWRVGGLQVEAEPEAWTVGTGGYFSTRWTINPVSVDR